MTDAAQASEDLLVGRQRELQRIIARLDGVETRGGIVLLSGAPGIGKTRLMHEVAAAAGERSVAVSWGRAYEGAGAPGCFLWTEALAGLGLDAPTGGADAPEVAGRFDAYARVVQSLRAHGPAVLLLDDLHAADRSSLDLLHFVARSLPSLRVLVVGTFRDVEANIDRYTADLIGRIGREGEILPLGSLTADESRRLVRQLLELDDPELARTVHQVTHGNPLFVRELSRLLHAHRGAATLPSPSSLLDPPPPDMAASLRGVELPYGVREAIRQRLSVLDDGARDVLSVASVIGREVDRELLGTVVEGEVDVAIDAGSELRLLSARGGRLQLAHDLIREVLYRDLPASRRARLHGRIADALEHLGADEHAVAIANHAIEASPTGAGELARRALAGAAAHRRRFAYEEAIALLERARVALPASSGGAARALVLLGLGEAHALSGDVNASRRIFAEAAELATAIDDAELLARAAWGYATEITPGLSPRDAVDLLERACNLLPSEDSAWRARVEARVAAARTPAIDQDALVTRARAALAMADRVGDPQTILDTYHAGAGALIHLTDLDGVITVCERAAELGVQCRDIPKTLRAQNRLICLELERGDLHRADVLIGEYEDLAHRSRLARHVWYALIFRAHRALHEGRYGDEAALYDRAHEVARWLRDPAIDRVRLIFESMRLWVRERADRYLVEGPSVAQHFAGIENGDVVTRPLHAYALAAAGEVEAARQELAGYDYVNWLPRLEPAIRARWLTTCFHLGEPEWARAAYERLVPHGERWTNCSMGVVTPEPIALGLGFGAATLEEWETAERWFRLALEICERHGCLPYEANAASGLALALARQGRTAESEAMRNRSAALADELELSCLSARLRRWFAETPKVEAAPGGDAAFSMRRDGDGWSLRGTDGWIRLRDSKGLRYLAALAERPDEEVAAVALHYDGSVPAEEALPGLDPKAKADYRRRLTALDDELAEAAEVGDATRAARAREEIEFLAAELARDTGLGGRDRPSGSAAERARVAVQRRIRAALKRIAEVDPALGQRLERDVKTGNYCRLRL